MDVHIFKKESKYRPNAKAYSCQPTLSSLWEDSKWDQSWYLPKHW